jgi:ADP-heptose:LPS heptosyltransferase
MTDGTPAQPGRQSLLVISATGLERFVPALGALGAIRAHHRDAHIVLLTSRSTSAFAETAPYFDEVWTDDSEGKRDLRGMLLMRKRLTAAQFTRVYDLDATPYTHRLFWLMFGLRAFNRAGLAWSGHIPGTALFHDTPRRDAMHLADRWAAQLKVTGIAAVLRPDLSWVARHVQSFSVPFRMTEPFVLIAATPGPGSTWTPERYGEMAQALCAAGQIPVIVGPGIPPEVCEAITEFCPAAVDLTGRATINEMIFLAWAATAALGPDNGVMHLSATAGCRSVVLFDAASDPARVGQRGQRISVLRRTRLSDISVAEVLATLNL